MGPPQDQGGGERRQPEGYPHLALSQVVLRTLLPGASFAAQGRVVKISMVGVAFGLSSLPSPWSCGGRLSFRPNRFPHELGRDRVTVLVVVVVVDDDDVVVVVVV